MAENNTSGVLDPATETNLNEKGTNSSIENEFYEASKRWRKQLNHLQIEIVNERNASELERESRVLEERMVELTTAQETLETIQSSTVEKLTLYGKFEEMSRKTNQILRQVGETIRDLRLREDEDNRSVVSRHTHSSMSCSKSKRSKSSRSSSQGSRLAVSRYPQDTRYHRLSIPTGY
jgi:vacuolar-type H+-ATPase subunit I/STV1